MAQLSSSSLFFYPLIASIFFLASSVSWISAATKKNGGGGITIDLIRRDSPLSPSYNPSKTHFERLQNAFERSVTRKSSLNTIKPSSSKTNTISENDLEAPVTPDGGEYLMKVGLGTPPVDILAIADTGSDLTWTQCLPCTECYKQKAPVFDPKKTSTYRTVSCQSQACSQVDGSSCGGENTCKYRYSYGDSSHTIGDLSVETLTFDSDVSFPKVLFGCGHDNGGTFGDNGSGIIGLGGGPLSIINQLSKSIGGKFSYCLTLIGSNATSKISLGANAVVAGPGVVSTPLVKKEPSTYYYLTLEGVSVGGKRVAGKRNVSDDSNSKAASVEEGNIIIDSGTTLTFVPSDFYEGVESALVGSVKGKRVNQTDGTFKLCYEKAEDFTAPPLIAHFTGADVELTQENTFLEVEQGVVCLTLLPSQDLAIFGNLHQMNYEIGYDLAGQKVTFLSKDCSKPE